MAPFFFVPFAFRPLTLLTMLRADSHRLSPAEAHTTTNSFVSVTSAASFVRVRNDAFFGKLYAAVWPLGATPSLLYAAVWPLGERVARPGSRDDEQFASQLRVSHLRRLLQTLTI